MSKATYVRENVRLEGAFIPDIRTNIRWSLVIGFLIIALFIIYMVGIEPMPALHNAFHDLRHGTGFPCH